MPRKLLILILTLQSMISALWESSIISYSIQFLSLFSLLLTHTAYTYDANQSQNYQTSNNANDNQVCSVTQEWVIVICGWSTACWWGRSIIYIFTCKTNPL